MYHILKNTSKQTMCPSHTTYSIFTIFVIFKAIINIVQVSKYVYILNIYVYTMMQSQTYGNRSIKLFVLENTILYQDMYNSVVS